MRRLSIVIATTLLLASSGAWAGGYGHGYRPVYGYGAPHRYGYGHGYGHGYRHGRHDHGYVAGALVVGTLLGYAISNSTRPAYVVQRQPVYVRSAPARVTRYESVYDSGGYGNAPAFTPGSYDRYYLRTSDGNCYLVNTYENGDENWTAVPAVNCQ